MIFKKLGNKNYWISTLVIVISLMLFKTIVADLIIKYVPISGFLLLFVVTLLIVFLSRLISEEILEVNNGVL